jgi:hypothetical protein
LIYASEQDVAEELPPIGQTVSFILSIDKQGLGAKEIRSARGAYGGGNPYISQGRPAAGGRASAPKITQEQLSTSIHKALHEAVREAVQPVADLEVTWSPEEMTKRIVRYLHKSATADLMTLQWRQAAAQFVEKATLSYNSACHEKAWFRDLDILPALSAACWQVAEACGGFPRPKVEEVHDLAAGWSKDRVEKSKVEKIIWEWLETNFPADEKVLGKLYKAIQATYSKAYETARNKSTGDSAKDAELFVKTWMQDSMGRVWAIQTGRCC